MTAVTEQTDASTRAATRTTAGQAESGAVLFTLDTVGGAPGAWGTVMASRESPVVPVHTPAWWQVRRRRLVYPVPCAYCYARPF